MNIALNRSRNHTSPFAEMDRVASRLNQVFGGRSPDFLVGTGWTPAVNVEETKDELLITAELPGLKAADVEVEIENGVLTLRGTKDEVQERTEERRYHVWERRHGSFQRAFYLPQGVAYDAVEAEFQDGVLRIRLPKAQEAKGRRIEIRTPSPNPS